MTSRAYNLPRRQATVMELQRVAYCGQTITLSDEGGDVTTGDEVAMARKALRCLYIEVAEPVARDVQRLVEAALEAQATRLRELERTAGEYRTKVDAYLNARSWVDIGEYEHLDGLRAAVEERNAAGAALDALLPPRDEREAQRRSFAYGNANISNPDVTREMVDEEADRTRDEQPAKGPAEVSNG